MKKTVLRAGNLAKKFPQLKETFRETAKTELLRGVKDIAAVARANAPVAEEDGGELRDSIGEFLGREGLFGGVAVNAPHAKHVELGTRKMLADPYLFPAAEQERPRIVRRVQRQMRKAAKEVARGNG